MHTKDMIRLLSFSTLVGAYFFAPLAVSAVTATTVTSPFSYNFTVDGSLAEANVAEKSSSGYWWVNSGGRMYLSGGEGKTIQGSLPATDTWRVLYAATNPVDTDAGAHPQNIFRLVGRSLWHNFTQQAYFTIKSDNLSTSSNRNASNGLLFFNRYQDGSTLYYAGVRVDGYAVIKKKYHGTYTTLSYVKIFPGTYNHDTNPNLLPKDTQIGMKTEVATTDGKVTIKLYTDVGKTGVWKLVATATDSTSIIDTPGFGGIRTDFMDASFDDYKIQEM